MRICIPVKDMEGKNSRIAKRIKIAKAFAIVEVSPSGNIENLEFVENHMSPEEIIPYIASRDVDMCVVNEISSNEEKAILNMGIDIIKNAFGKIETTIKLIFERGNI